MKIGALLAIYILVNPKWRYFFKPTYDYNHLMNYRLIECTQNKRG